MPAPTTRPARLLAACCLRAVVAGQPGPPIESGHSVIPAGRRRIAGYMPKVS